MKRSGLATALRAASSAHGHRATPPLFAADELAAPAARDGRVHAPCRPRRTLRPRGPAALRALVVVAVEVRRAARSIAAPGRAHAAARLLESLGRRARFGEQPFSRGAARRRRRRQRRAPAQIDVHDARHVAAAA